MYTEIIKIIFTSFCQNTTELYDKHILLTMLCIFWPEFGLKPIKLFCITSNGKQRSFFFKHLKHPASVTPKSVKIICIF